MCEEVIIAGLMSAPRHPSYELHGWEGGVERAEPPPYEAVGLPCMIRDATSWAATDTECGRRIRRHAMDRPGLDW
jgi:hypothetical protein